MMTEITSKDNQILKELRKLAGGKKYRTQAGLYVCEGEKLFTEAVRSGKSLRYALWDKSALDSMDESTRRSFNTAQESGCRMLCTDDVLYDSVTMLENYRGVIFTCEIADSAIEIEPGKGYLALDGVQDPGNVGTILRTADAFGISVFLLDGCADVYNPKTVRAAMGSLFRVPFSYITREEYIERMHRAGRKIYATALRDTSVPLGTVAIGDASLVIGSEGNGVSEMLLSAADGHVILPMKGITESLNAAIAASIVMWEMSKVCQ